MRVLVRWERYSEDLNKSGKELYCLAVKYHSEVTSKFSITVLGR